MPALVAGIHVFENWHDVDGRDKPGHDAESLSKSLLIAPFADDDKAGDGCYQPPDRDEDSKHRC
jgi:hypothetical protein